MLIHILIIFWKEFVIFHRHNNTENFITVILPEYKLYVRNITDFKIVIVVSFAILSNHIKSCNTIDIQITMNYLIVTLLFFLGCTIDRSLEKDVVLLPIFSRSICPPIYGANITCIGIQYIDREDSHDLILLQNIPHSRNVLSGHLQSDQE